LPVTFAQRLNDHKLANGAERAVRTVFLYPDRRQLELPVNDN